MESEYIRRKSNLDGGILWTATKQSLPELLEAVQDWDVWRNLIMNVIGSHHNLMELDN